MAGCSPRQTSQRCALLRRLLRRNHRRCERRLPTRDERERRAHVLRLREFALHAAPGVKLFQRGFRILARRNRLHVCNASRAISEHMSEIDAFFLNPRLRFCGRRNETSELVATMVRVSARSDLCQRGMSSTLRPADKNVRRAPCSICLASAEEPRVKQPFWVRPYLRAPCPIPPTRS